MSDIVAATRAVSPVPSTGALARRTAARVLATVAIGLGVWLCAAGVATASQHGTHHHHPSDHEFSGPSLHIAGISVQLPGAHAHHREHAATHRHPNSPSSSAAKSSTAKSEPSTKATESTRHSSTQDSPTSVSAATTAKKTPTHETTAAESTPTKKTAPKKTATKKAAAKKASAKKTATKRTERPVRSETAPRPTKEHKSSTTPAPAPQDSTTGGGLLGTGTLLNVVTQPVTDVTSSLLAPKPHNPSDPAPGGGGIFTPPANDSGTDYSGDQQDSGGAYTTQEITAPEQVAQLQRPANAPRVEHHAATATSKIATVHTTPKRTTTENHKTVAPQHKQAEPTTTTQFVTTTEAPAQVATDHAQPPASNHPAPSPQPEPLPAPSAPTVTPAHTGLGNDRTPLAILPPHTVLPLSARTIALHSSPAHAESALLGLPNTAPD